MHNKSGNSIANNNNCQGVIPMQTKVLYFKMKYLWRSIQYESETCICIAFDDVHRCTSVLHPTYDHDNVKFMNMDFDSHAEQMSSCKKVQLFQLIGCVVFPLIRFSRVHLFYIKNIFMSCGCELHHLFFASFSQTNKNEKDMCIASYFTIYSKMMQRKETISFNLNRFFFLFLFCYHSNQKKIVRLLLTATQILVNILSIIFALRMSLKFGKNIRCFTCEPFFHRHCCKRAPLL